MRIGWLSRHIPLPAQVRELERIYGSVEIVPLVGSLPHGGYKDVDEIVELMERENIEVAVVVLPLSMIERLLKEAKDRGWTLLRAEMEQQDISDVAEFDPDSCVEANGRIYCFKGFSIIEDVSLITRPLT